MKTHGTTCLLASLVIVFVSVVISMADNTDLLKAWSNPNISVHERAKAVNHAFTNGTPIRAIVKVLGTNYSAMCPYSSVWAGPGPEPRKTCSLVYPFREDGVVIGTDVEINGDPLTGKFSGAGSWQAVRRRDESTNRIWIGTKEGAPKENQPSRAQTNRVSN